MYLKWVHCGKLLCCHMQKTSSIELLVFSQVANGLCQHYTEVSAELSSAMTTCIQTREFTLCTMYLSGDKCLEHLMCILQLYRCVKTSVMIRLWISPFLVTSNIKDFWHMAYVRSLLLLTVLMLKYQPLSVIFLWVTVNALDYCTDGTTNPNPNPLAW